jgi:hypothetical protein
MDKKEELSNKINALEAKISTETKELSELKDSYYNKLNPFIHIASNDCFFCIPTNLTGSPVLKQRSYYQTQEIAKSGNIFTDSKEASYYGKKLSLYLTVTRLRDKVNGGPRTLKDNYQCYLCLSRNFDCTEIVVVNRPWTPADEAQPLSFVSTETMEEFREYFNDTEIIEFLTF